MRSRVRARDVVALCGGVLATAITVDVLRALPGGQSDDGWADAPARRARNGDARRRWTATAVAVATGAYNFFFFPPVGTFTIDDPQNWVRCVAFLVAAVIASKLSAAAQARAQEAIARRNEVTRLFDLTRDVLLTSEAAGAIDALARHVARRFELSRVAICLPGDHGWRIIKAGARRSASTPTCLNNALAKARGTLEFDAHQRAYGGHVRVVDGADSVLILPLRHGTRAIGLLAAAAPAIDVGTLDAVAGVVAIAIERTQFLGEREAAELVRQKAELAGNAPRIAEPRPQDPADRDTRGRRKPAGRASRRRTTDPGRRGDRWSSSVSIAYFRTSWTWRVSMPRRSTSNVNGSRRPMWSTPRPHTSGTSSRAIR